MVFPSQEIGLVAHSVAPGSSFALSAIRAILTLTQTILLVYLLINQKTLTQPESVELFVCHGL